MSASYVMNSFIRLNRAKVPMVNKLYVWRKKLWRQQKPNHVQHKQICQRISNHELHVKSVQKTKWAQIPSHLITTSTKLAANYCWKMTITKYATIAAARHTTTVFALLFPLWWITFLDQKTSHKINKMNFVCNFL